MSRHEDQLREASLEATSRLGQVHNFRVSLLRSGASTVNQARGRVISCFAEEKTKDIVFIIHLRILSIEHWLDVQVCF